jgi:hypothetical protein
MNFKRIIREEVDDFDFINNTDGLDGVSFTVEWDKDQIYHIKDNGGDRVVVHWMGYRETHESTTYKREEVMKLFNDGDWVPVL